MFYIAICDDDEFFCLHEKQLIAKYMEQFQYDYRISVFRTGIELLESQREEVEYNIIFLDIKMKELDGIETAVQLRNMNQTAYLVFVTAFISYALEGYKLNAIRYLLKNDKNLENAINECLDAIISSIVQRNQKHRFEFREGTKEIFLEQIMFIESNLHKLLFNMDGSERLQYTMYEKLDCIEDIFKERGFCRIHKSYLVNLKYVSRIKRYQLELTNGRLLNIARARYMDVKKEYTFYQGEME